MGRRSILSELVTYRASLFALQGLGVMCYNGRGVSDHLFTSKSLFFKHFYEDHLFK